MGRFRSLVDTPKRLVVFRANYEIPDDVRVSYCPDDYVDFRRGIETMIIPLFAFIEGGGVRNLESQCVSFLLTF